MVLNSLVARLPYPSRSVQKAVGIAAIVAQAGIGVTGSVVRVTGSGLGCATWPECQPGSMVPVAHDELHGLHQWVEFSNRMLIGLVILVSVIALITAWRVHLDRPGKRLLALAWTLPSGVVLQAVVGGMTVLAKLEWWTVAIHFLVSTPLIWLAVLLLHGFLEGDGQPRWRVPPIARTLLVVLIVAMWGILIAGTTVTGAGPHGGDPNTHRLDAPIEMLARVHSGILVVYLLVLAVIGLTLLRAGAPKRLWRRYGLVWLVAVAQGILGVVQYALGVPEALVSLHVLGSALVIISTAALWCEARDRGAFVSHENSQEQAGELTAAG
ncbi:COX15/CtaA family protein [Amycolatopsis alkalitolerans]|uniref:Heme A synthase n=1 Tax=Amycolatopsis alkalitolerans TaxID=2547244 RepID=A0A5C4LXX0_9PSEU|nr:COX15/CtaA family protein [Amycolatopsis alkalitolerans]TNC23013.1 heme A synthase [Amycolatopsis alkalitolerans]